MKKRILALLLTVLILIGTMPVAPIVSAMEWDGDEDVTELPDEDPELTAEPTITVSDADIYEGTETAEFTLSIENNPGVWGIIGYVNYDDSMCLADFENGDVFDSSDLVVGSPMDTESIRDIVVSENRIAKRTYEAIGASYESVLATQIYYEYSSYESTNTSNGILASFSLYTAGLLPGTYEIAFYFDDHGIIDAEGDYVPFETVYGTLTVVECDHEYDEGVITPPSCLEEGYTTYTCELCFNSYSDDYTDALGHNYVENSVPPACVGQGYLNHVCDRCGDSYKDTYVEALGHDFDEGCETQAPTCTEDGVWTKTCQRENCDGTVIVVDEGDHLPSCTGSDYSENMNKSFTYSYPGAKALTIRFSSNSELENGYDKILIYEGGSVDGTYLGYYTGYLSSVVVTVNSDTFTIQMTTDVSVKRYGFEVSSVEVETVGIQTETEAIPALDHDFGEECEITPPTCTENGYTTYSCIRCGYSYEDNYVEAFGHEYAETVFEPTCSVRGYTVYACGICDYSYVGNYVDALGHEFDEGKQTKDPTCEEDGIVTKNCLREGCDGIVIDEGDHLPSCTGNSYTNNMNDTFTYTYPGATSLTINFSENSELESGFDYIYVYEGSDATGSSIASFTGSFANASVTVNSDTFTIRMTSDHSVTEHGFEVSTVEVHMVGNVVYLERISALGHDYEDSIETVLPTCTEQGYTKHLCSRCGSFYGDDYVEALGHIYDEGVVTADPTCTGDGIKTFTCQRNCGEIGSTYTENISRLGHDYISSEPVPPTCEDYGYTLYSCSRCSSEYSADYVDALGHDFQLFSIVDSTCTENGVEEYKCSRCDTFDSIIIKPHGHEYGEWTVDKEPLLLEEGHRYRDCSVCGDREEETIDRITVDYEEDYGYGLANFTVVNAQTLEPIANAQIFISTEDEGEDTFVTDAYGKVSVILPVGSQTVSAYAEGCLIRNIKFSIESGVNDLAPIGLSSLSTYDAIITSTEMTQQEIIDAGIDINAPGNQQVVKYEMKIQFEPEVDWESITFYFNADGDYIVPNPDPVPVPDPEDPEEKYVIHYHIVGTSHEWCRVEEVEPNTTEPLKYKPTKANILYSFDGWYEDSDFTKKITSKEITEKVTYVYGRWLYLGNPETQPTPTPPKPSGDNTLVYPVSENFYLIIRGQVKWQKEMFDVEMLIVNNSMVDTLEDITATLNLPEGLSLATMAGEQQSASQYVGHIGKGETRSVHWYVRGDVAGSYALEARLTGVTMPYGEVIDQVFRSEEMLQVWAGNALHLNYEFPDAAYYADDYPIKVTLTNVSDKSLYNVSHGLNVIQGMEIYYSDGTDKKKIDESSWKEVGVKELCPGDSIIIEITTNIFFESEIMEREIERYLSLVDGAEVLYKTAKVVSFFTDLGGFVSGCIDGSIVSVEGLMDYGGYLPDMKAVLGGFWGQLIELNEMYKNYKDASLDATTGIIAAEVEEELKALAEDPQKWMETHDERDIKNLTSKIKIMISIVKGEPESERFDIFDSLRTAISSIPIKFAFQSVIFSTDASSTTTIPYSYTVYDAGPRYFGVSSVSKYMDALTVAVAGTVYEELVPWYVQLIPGLDDPLDMEEAVKYIQATEKEIIKFKAKDATGEVTFRAWVEKSSSAYMMRTSSATEDLIISGGNRNSVYENGVLTFTGAGTIMIEPANMNGGTLYIEDSEGNLYTYVIGVVEQHECYVGETETIVSPTAETEGFGVKRCEVCKDILDIEIMNSENCEHSFTEWETKAEATCTDVGFISRSCTVCGMIEQEFTGMLSHTEGEWETVIESTCTEVGMEQTSCTVCGEVITREIEMLPHTEGEWIIFKAPTAFEKGINQLHCAICDAVMLETDIPMTEETFGLELENETRLVTGIPLYITPAMLVAHYENMDMDIELVCKTAYVGTGCTIIYEGIEFTVIIAGDINGDGILNSRDSLLQKTYITQKAEPTEAQRISADMDGNGVLNARDVLLLKKLLVK